jgi:hypothetical protein
VRKEARLLKRGPRGGGVRRSGRARGLGGGLSGLAGRLSGRVARLGGRLSDGVPRGLVAVAAIVVLALTLYAVATKEAKGGHGYAEFTMFRAGCVVAPAQRQNVAGCRQITPLLYRVNFTESLAGSTAIVSRGSCCPGQIRASLLGSRSVLVVIPKPPKQTQPVRASVFVP